MGPGPYTRIQWALNHIPGYSGPWTINKDKVVPGSYTRIQWALDHISGYSLISSELLAELCDLYSFKGSVRDKMKGG